MRATWTFMAIFLTKAKITQIETLTVQTIKSLTIKILHLVVGDNKSQSLSSLSIVTVLEPLASQRRHPSRTKMMGQAAHTEMMKRKRGLKISISTFRIQREIKIQIILKMIPITAMFKIKTMMIISKIFWGLVTLKDHWMRWVEMENAPTHLHQLISNLNIMNSTNKQKKVWIDLRATIRYQKTTLPIQLTTLISTRVMIKVVKKIMLSTQTK